MREPDIEAIITCKRTNSFHSGYRPVHLVKDDYLTTGIHQYYEKDTIESGESSLGTITFITPEAYPNCLWKGKEIAIQEGSMVVGYAVVTKIFNPILEAKE